MKRPLVVILLIAFIVAVTFAWQWRPLAAPDWSDAELAEMRSMWLASLGPLPPDPSNRVADNLVAARLGQALFFDPRLSRTGGVACATCHQPDRKFTDGLDKGQALSQSKRNTPSLVGTAYSPWLYWDGRRDSQWAQALSPLEDPAEHGSNRMALAHVIAQDDYYRAQYRSLFGELPALADHRRFPRNASPLGDETESDAWSAMQAADRQAVNEMFANLGKAIAAYERRLLHGESRFDEYVAAVAAGGTGEDVFDSDEAQGLRLFLGKARCTECHNGPLLSNSEFHNNGVLAYPGDLPDEGRSIGLRRVRSDPFNCLGAFNDEGAPYCGELRFARDGVELIGSFRTASLRNLEGTAPYMHKGQLRSLSEVIDHYNRAPLAMIGHNESEFPLSLNRRQRLQLEAFLRTLDSPIDVDASWLTAPTRGATVSTSRGMKDGSRQDR
ncbi:MAG: cytochrome c peroxidase [Pseudomonadota bacterium]